MTVSNRKMQRDRSFITLRIHIRTRSQVLFDYFDDSLFSSIEIEVPGALAVDGSDGYDSLHTNNNTAVIVVSSSYFICSLAGPFTEPERIQTRVLNFEPKAHHPPGQFGQSTFCPLHFVAYFVGIKRD